MPGSYLTYFEVSGMLRSRSRAVLGKQALVTDHHRPQPSPAPNNNCKSSFFCSGFRGFLSNLCSEHKAMISSTFVLDLKPFSSIRASHIPTKFPGKKHSWEDFESRGIGLAMVDKLFDRIPERNHHKPQSNRILFGPSLKVQIPSLPPHALIPTNETPKSPTDFGTKSRNLQLSATFKTPNSGHPTPKPNSPRLLMECLSVSEMELSEDYTQVIYHGPNPRTTHIFDNCVVESYRSVVPKPKRKSGNFLSSCYTCKKSLEQTNDIFIYRGEKAFCSQECRHQEIVLDGADQAVDSIQGYN